MRFLTLCSFLVPVFLAACTASSYTRDGIAWDGGVEAQMITNDTARISARGNGFTDQARVVDFVILKAAETAEAQGFTHFAMLSTTDASRVSAHTTPGTMQTNVYGNSAYTTYNPGMTHAVVKPGADTIVRFCKQPPQACGDMLSALEVVKNLGPKYLKN
jgi:hypothetical protein